MADKIGKVARIFPQNNLNITNDTENIEQEPNEKYL